MNVQYQLQGTFYRTLLSGEAIQPVSLHELFQEVQTVATQTHNRTSKHLRESFGLDFLPQPILIDLLKQANQVTEENELYQLSCLQLLHPHQTDSASHQASTYSYEFRAEVAEFDLTPDDRQLPAWMGSDLEKLGNYTINLDSPQYLGLSDTVAQQIWQQALITWEQLPEIEKIELFLKSFGFQEASLKITPQLTVTVTLQDLSLPLREAITFIRQEIGDTSVLSDSAATLVQQYEERHRIHLRSFPDDITPNSNLGAGKKFVMQRGKNRNYITKIIQEANQFLLISSYIIEDERLTELICQKSLQLPQGVWILTDLRNEVIDRIDAQVEVDVNLPAQYQRSDERKIRCIKNLLNANVRIRSGAFHLKTCISEQLAYLGSCNLTPGSLDYNLESGFFWRNTPIHEQLIHCFRYFWEQKSRDEVIPTPDGFDLRFIQHPSQDNEQNNPNLLTVSRYEQDLTKNLREFRGKVFIYTRSFNPTPEIHQLLRLSDTRVFIDAQMSANAGGLSINKTDSLHAKVTILGDEVAYVGGINFNFSHGSMNDLIYKTTKKQEIHRIQQAISSLN